MHETTINNGGLPENAYRELKPGEEYIPVMLSSKSYPEVTAWSVFWGILMAIIFTAATAYSGLKIGQVFEAAIAIAIIAVGISKVAKTKGALGQNVIIQSIGASSGVIVAGAVFTIPGLFILGLEVEFYQIFFSSLLGGFLGILFLIPFRKYFVKDMHGKFPFPEATATTEILISGEKGGSGAGVLVVSAIIGGVYDLLFSFFKLWHENINLRVLQIGNDIAEKVKIEFRMGISALIFSFGYLVGLKYSVIIASGSLLAWFVLVPLVNAIGDIAVGAGGTNIFAGMEPGLIFRDYVRHIGIGAIAMAGIIGIIKSSGVIGKAFKMAFSGFGGGKKEVVVEERTQRDIKMSLVVSLIAVTLIAVFAFFIFGLEITLMQAIVALLTVFIITFLFTTVAANAIAIVGQNPVSGMTLMTLILSSFILVQVGLQGKEGMASALIIGGIVCTALSMAGGFVTDLKIGYWMGSSPYKQESWKFLGTIVSAATVGIVIFILNKAYGFVVTPQTPDPMTAPQANAMVAVIQPLLTSGAEIKWMLYLAGAVISVIISFLGLPPLAFALGMYLPIELNTPLLVGGIIAHFVGKSSKDEKLVNARVQRGTLISSGFIAGAALFGVLGALLVFLDKEYAWNLDKIFEWWPEGSIIPEVLPFVAFGLIIVYFIWDIYRAKVED